MLAKKQQGYLLIVMAVTLLLVITYIASRTDSPIARAVQWISNSSEGFTAAAAGAATAVTPQCPAGYTFFNDSRGESFCCNGKVNPYTHACVSNRSPSMCAMKPGARDAAGAAVPLCSSMISQIAQEGAQNFCPPSLPNYATRGKCCQTGADMDGRDCMRTDLADKERYCLTTGTPAAGERMCSELRMFENATCPDSLQKVNYKLGAREERVYPGASGKKIPICTGVDNTCIPDNVVTELQKSGIFSGKTVPEGWKYSCSGYEKRVVRSDLTGTMDVGYP